MNEEDITRYLSRHPDAPEPEYVGFLLSDEAGLAVPVGLTKRKLLIYALEWCEPGWGPSPWTAPSVTTAVFIEVGEDSSHGRGSGNDE